MKILIENVIRAMKIPIKNIKKKKNSKCIFLRMGLGLFALIGGISDPVTDSYMHQHFNKRN